MFLSSPASYMSSGDPAVFGRSEVVVKDAATGVQYTPADYRQLFTDAHLPRRAPDRELLHRVRQVPRSG